VFRNIYNAIIAGRQARADGEIARMMRHEYRYEDIEYIKAQITKGAS